MYGKVRIHYGVKPLIKLQYLHHLKNNCERHYVELGRINVPLAISHRNLKFVQHCAVRKFESDWFQHILSSRADVEQKVNVKERAWKIWKKKKKLRYEKFALVGLMTQQTLNFPTIHNLLCGTRCASTS